MHPYDAIIALPHHVSVRRHGMSRHDRAAQFAPFAALTGHDAAIRETARLTDGRIELDEDRKAVLNRTLQLLLNRIALQPEITVTYFLPDSKKDGGSYTVVSGNLKKIDDFTHSLILTNGLSIPMEQIVRLDQPDDESFSQDWNE